MAIAGCRLSSPLAPGDNPARRDHRRIGDLGDPDLAQPKWRPKALGRASRILPNVVAAGLSCYDPGAGRVYTLTLSPVPRSDRHASHPDSSPGPLARRTGFC